MSSIRIFRRERRRADGTRYQEENFTAHIKFGRSAEFQRNTETANEKEAKRVAKRLADEFEREELPKLSGDKITVDMIFGHWWESYAKRKSSSSDMWQMASVIMPLLGNETLVQDLDDEKIEQLVIDLEDGPRGPRSGARINRYVDVLRKALRLSRRHWRASRKLFPDVDWAEWRQSEKKERIVFVSLEEARRLHDQLPPHIADAFKFALVTGARLNEVKTLTWDRVSFESCFAQVLAKGGHLRPIYLNAPAREVLTRLYASRTSDKDTIFDLTNRRRRWEAAREEIGRDDLRWHDLRHGAAQLMGEHGKADLKVIGRQLGHSGQQTTERYRHVVDHELAAAMEAIPDFTKD